MCVFFTLTWLDWTKTLAVGWWTLKMDDIMPWKNVHKYQKCQNGLKGQLWCFPPSSSLFLSSKISIYILYILKITRAWRSVAVSGNWNKNNSDICLSFWKMNFKFASSLDTSENSQSDESKYVCSSFFVQRVEQNQCNYNVTCLFCLKHPNFKPLKTVLPDWIT